MIEGFVYSFLVISCCVLLFLVWRIWLNTNKGSQHSKTDTKLFNILSDIYIIVDGAGFITNVNVAFKSVFPDFKIQLGKTLFEDFIRYLESITSETVPEDTYWLLATPNKLIHGAEITITKDGNNSYYLLSRDLISENRGYEGFIVTLADISDYRKSNDEVKKSILSNAKKSDETDFEAKSAFLTNILSHEIRTPLNVIIGTGEVAKTVSEHEKVLENLDKINDAAKYLSGTINNALDILSFESNKFVLYEQPFKFADMIRNIVEANMAAAKSKKQEFKTVIDKNIPSVLISDEFRLSQVLNNLLSNSVRYTPFNGNIEFDIRLIAQKKGIVRLQFSVKDDGIGVSEEMKGKLFNVFKQNSSGYSRKYKGTAMGLAISQRIVGLLGSSIHVESDPGRGSLFYFEIDVRVSDEKSANDIKVEETSILEEKTDYDFSGHTILLAEDIEINREIIKELLNDTGIEIECAEDGARAVGMYLSAKKGKYSMIYMDIQMPGLDGYAATKKIREQDTNIPIIAMTADASANDIIKCKQAGMNDHIAKPIDVYELLQKTAKYINSI